MATIAEADRELRTERLAAELARDTGMSASAARQLAERIINAPSLATDGERIAALLPRTVTT